MEKEKNVNEDRRPLAIPRLNEFKGSLRNGNCPFCGKKMKWYDGCLGYEAYKCYGCKFTIDHSGMHLDDDQFFLFFSERLNPFGLRILQIVDFFEVSGVGCCLNPQIMISGFQQYCSKAFEPIYSFAENHKSFMGFKLPPPPARNFEKIKAVLPPSHLIGRAGYL